MGKQVDTHCWDYSLNPINESLILRSYTAVYLESDMVALPYMTDDQPTNRYYRSRR
jgi:hypothetical protein